MMIARVLLAVLGSTVVVPRGDVACVAEAQNAAVVLSGQVRLGKGLKLADVEVLVSVASYDREFGFSARDVVEGLALSDKGRFLLTRSPGKGQLPSMYVVTASARKYGILETVVVRPGYCVEFNLVLPVKD
jgi:hypothetical protein